MKKMNLVKQSSTYRKKESSLKESLKVRPLSEGN